jgi:RNA polymerase sigma factor (sigma-70 family)
MMPKPLPIPSVDHADLLAEVLALRPEVERILRGDSRHPDAESLEDKTQIVLLKVTRHLGDYQQHADGMRPWLSRIAKNVQRDAARSAWRRRHFFGYRGVSPDDVIDDAACLERRAAARALLRKVVEVMAEMPEQLRTVLVLVAFERLDHEQVATKLAITIPAVKMRLLRAREYLREHAGTLDDHLAVLAPVFIDERRSGVAHGLVRFGSWFGPLLPPLLASVLTTLQIEMPPPVISPRVVAQPPSNTSTAAEPTTISRPPSTVYSRAVLSARSMQEPTVTAAARHSDPGVHIDVKPPGKTLPWRKTR